MGADVRRPAGDTDHSDIGALAGLRVGDIKGVGTRVDAGNNLLARPLSVGGRVAQMGNVLVGAVPVRFGDAGDFNVWHGFVSF
jgi:hypothetical protein